MTVAGGFIAPDANEDSLGIHSLDRFTLVVPDLKQAENFYHSFGLSVKDEGRGLAVRGLENDHVWCEIVEGDRKHIHHHTFAAYEGDFSRLKRLLEGNGIKFIDAPPGFESNGIWFRDHDGILIELKVAPKSSPKTKSHGIYVSPSADERGAPYRRDVEAVKPNRLSHILMFTRDVTRAIDFYSRNLGMRLSDRTSDVIAFMHGIHGSDHHMVAFVKSEAPGFHHCSWDMSSVEDVGLGAVQMADKGFSEGWGVGRHVLGSNYFHYVKDPWGSYCEYSADIDFVSAGTPWEAKDHEADDGFYLWGPVPPEDFARNYESAD